MLYEVILDGGETANKCTIAPLADRPDFRIIRVRGDAALGPFNSPWLLHPDGECLTRLGKSSTGIASIDCVWRRLDLLLSRVSGPLPRLVRIPDGFQTAYPRRSKYGLDPDGGLATIEAIFVASALLGQWDETLFARYHFGGRFIEVNAARFLELGVSQAGSRPVSLTPPPRRNARDRRLDRQRPVLDD